MLLSKQDTRVRHQNCLLRVYHNKKSEEHWFSIHSLEFEVVTPTPIHFMMPARSIISSLLPLYPIVSKRADKCLGLNQPASDQSRAVKRGAFQPVSSAKYLLVRRRVPNTPPIYNNLCLYKTTTLHQHSKIRISRYRA